MKLQIKFLLLIFSLFLNISIQAQTYHCVQENGVVLYTDLPCPPKKQATVASAPTTTNTANTAPATEENPAHSAERYFEPIDYSQLKSKIKSYDFSLLFLVGYILMSLICFIAYKRDKQAAINETRRTPETRLHLYEFLGGWPGGLIAQKILRHKNRKPSYQIEFWLIVIINLVITGYILWLQKS